LDINSRRANALTGHDDHFKQGYATGGFLLALALAFALWFVVQHAVRKRSGYPPWIALIAIGFSLLFALLDVVRDNRAQAKAPAAATATPCARPADPFGPPPAGFRYTQATTAERSQALQQMPHIDARGSDVAFAIRGGERVAVLVGIPDLDAGFLSGAERKAREVGLPWRYQLYGGARALTVKYTDTGAYAVFGLRDCVGLIVTGLEPRGVDEVAQAVLK
jgi:hypothetical protein